MKLVAVVICIFSADVIAAEGRDEFIAKAAICAGSAEPDLLGPVNNFYNCGSGKLLAVVDGWTDTVYILVPKKIWADGLTADSMEQARQGFLGPVFRKEGPRCKNGKFDQGTVKRDGAGNFHIYFCGQEILPYLDTVYLWDKSPQAKKFLAEYAALKKD